jgi:hypothetical protein
MPDSGFVPSSTVPAKGETVSADATALPVAIAVPRPAAIVKAAIQRVVMLVFTVVFL